MPTCEAAQWQRSDDLQLCLAREVEATLVFSDWESVRLDPWETLVSGLRISQKNRGELKHRCVRFSVRLLVREVDCPAIE